MFNQSMQTSNAAETFKSAEPQRSRAVFCQEDFKLIRTAISQYLQQNGDRPDWAKYSNLYHRLGRLT